VLLELAGSHVCLRLMLLLLLCLLLIWRLGRLGSVGEGPMGEWSTEGVPIGEGPIGESPDGEGQEAGTLVAVESMLRGDISRVSVTLLACRHRCAQGVACQSRLHDALLHARHT